MQRKSFLKLLLNTLGYTVMGNALCTIMTVSMAVFIGSEFMKALSAILASVLFFSLIFTVGYKDGLREKKMFDLKRIGSIPQNRWIGIGFAAAGVAVVPSLVLLVVKIMGSELNMFVFRMLNGAVYAISMFIAGNSVNETPVYAPLVFMLFYALIPVFCRFGFYVAVSGKFTKDKLMYK